MRRSGLRFGQTHLCVFRVREAADRVHCFVQSHRRAADRVGCCHKAVLNRRWNEQQSTGDISRGKNVRRGRSQVRIDEHKAPSIDLGACRREIQFGRVRLPADGHDRERRFRAIAVAVLLVIHTHAAWRFLERFDLAEVFTNDDPRAAKRGGDGRRNIFIFRRQNSRAAMEELHSRAKRIEDRSHLRPGSAAANHQHRRRHGGQAPGIAVRVRELESGDVEPPTDSARAKDEFLRPQPQPGLLFRLCVDRRIAQRRRVRTRTRPAHRSVRAMWNEHAHLGRPRGLARAAGNSPAPARLPQCRIVRAVAPRGLAALREPAFVREQARHWPPCRRTRLV